MREIRRKPGFLAYADAQVKASDIGDVELTTLSDKQMTKLRRDRRARAILERAPPPAPAGHPPAHLRGRGLAGHGLELLTSQPTEHP